MSKYLHYTPEEFAQDEFFIQWVCTAEIEAENYWQDWLETYPFKQKDIQEARQLVLMARQLPLPQVTALEINELKQAVFREIEQIETIQRLGSRPLSRFIWSAACTIGLMLAIWYWFDNTDGGLKNKNGADSAGMSAIGKGMVTFENTGTSPRLVLLPDGSTVVLSPNSMLQAPKAFDEDQRVVHLKGEAFFEVVKNPAQPFRVHAQEIVTKVLGTSFNIRAFPDQSDIRVMVKTGKVSVYSAKASASLNRHASDELSADLILEADEEGIFDKKTAELRFSSRTAKDAEDLFPILDIPFEYDETPVKTVFNDLEKAYYVKIVYDEAVINNCPVTASFGDEPLHEKLRLICLAIRASYEIQEHKIVITGKGCN